MKLKGIKEFVLTFETNRDRFFLQNHEYGMIIKTVDEKNEILLRSFSSENQSKENRKSQRRHSTDSVDNGKKKRIKLVSIDICGWLFFSCVVIRTYVLGTPTA